MTDRKPLQQLDLIDAPDRWQQISTRPVDPDVDLDSGRHPSTRKRIALAAVALVIGLSATVALAVAFRHQGTATPSATAAPVLEVSCEGDTVTVQTPVVAAQADGLHVLGTVTGLHDPSIVIKSFGDPSAAYLSASSGVDDEFVREVPPGEAKVGCISEPTNEAEMAAALKASFTISDPNGYFVDYVPSCGDTLGVSSFADGSPEPGSGATQEDAVRSVVDGVQPGDVIEPAGYIQAASVRPIARITRDGGIIASFHMSEFRDEFVVYSGIVCRDSGLSARS